MSDGESPEISNNSCLIDNSLEKPPEIVDDISLPSDSSPLANTYDSQNHQNSIGGITQDPSISDLLRESADVIYEGGLEDKEEIEYKVVVDNSNNNDILGQNGEDVEIDVRGIKYKIPFAIECHLCNEMMNLCVRRTRYRGQSREYPAYRCNRKGCQTFRSIRKVFGNCPTTDSERSVNIPTYNAPITPSPMVTPKRICNRPMHRGEFSDDDNDDFVCQRVYLPKVDHRLSDPKVMSVTERMKKANQERATVFSEFADQLRRDIAATKRVRVRKQISEDDEQQGTLFYISKELTPQEIIELQDTIIKTLISLRKIPPPMTMHDLPVFANCPYSKKDLEAGLMKSQEDFWTAMTNSPQPPIPEGFTRRKDDTLIYRDPKPYTVPEILQENSPRKQADAVINYHRRKEQQDARRMERRHVEKKYRSWASLKREFDMAETTERPCSKMSRMSYNELNAEQQARQVTFRELMNKMGDTAAGQLSCRIRASSSDQSNDSLQWIDLKSSNEKNNAELSGTPDSEGKQSGSGDFSAKTKFKTIASSSSMQDMIKSLSTPSALRTPSPFIRSFSSIDGSLKNPLTPQSPMFFSDQHFFNNNHHSSSFYTLSPFIPQYQMSSTIDSSLLYRDLGEDHYHCVGASEVVRTETTTVPPFTYIHPDSGVRLTDPSAFLTTFIPSPITKLAPINFNEETPTTTRPRRSSEPSTSTSLNIDNIPRSEEKDANAEENKEELDDFLKFDSPPPPQTED
ncbi:unnamed protein product [Caenorhabditis brenneri]